MNGLPQHARFIRHERDDVVCFLPCGWRVRLAAREEAAARFREHMATVNMAPTPDRFTADLSVRPGITIPPLTLLVSCLVGAAMWVAIGAAVVGCSVNALSRLVGVIPMDAIRAKDRYLVVTPRHFPVVVAELHPVGSVRTGGWCEPCALPSLVEQDFVLADRRTLKVGGRGTFRVCADCGARP